MNDYPFGHFTLSKREKFARKFGKNLGRDPISKLLRSALKLTADIKSSRPRDVAVFNSQKARLHPYDNICEKRVFLTPHLWEAQERAFLRDHIKNFPHQNFYFVDAGANVGLYTLYARSVCSENNKKIRAACIEPEDIVRSRLKFNLLASQAENEVEIFSTALSDKEQDILFSSGEKNLGESKIHSGNTPPESYSKTIKAIPLLAIIKQSNFTRIDALKIDIEGYELQVLSAFFKTAAPTLYPALIIVEVAHQENKDELFTLLEMNDYTLANQSRGNCVYIKN